MSKNKTKINDPSLDYTLELEVLRMELSDVEFEIDSLRDKERYLKVEIEKAEAKFEDGE